MGIKVAYFKSQIVCLQINRVYAIALTEIAYGRSRARSLEDHYLSIDTKTKVIGILVAKIREGGGLQK